VVPEESADGAKSAAVVPESPPTREGQVPSLPQPALAAASTASATAADAALGIVGEAGPSSPRPVVDEVLVSGKPAAALQEHIAPEGTTRVVIEAKCPIFR
jgi:hypothetical protein